MLATGKQVVVVAIAANDQPLVCGLRRECHEMFGVMIGEILRAGGRERRIGQGAAGAGARRLAVEQRRLAQRADPAFAGDRLVDDAEDRPAVLKQRDQRAEDWPPRHEADRAVDRVEHPLARRVGTLGAIFLADDPVARRLGIEQAAHYGLGSAVGLGDRRSVRLGFMGKAGAEQRPDRGAGGIGKGVGEREVGGNGHATGASAVGPHSPAPAR